MKTTGKYNDFGLSRAYGMCGGDGIGKDLLSVATPDLTWQEHLGSQLYNLVLLKNTWAILDATHAQSGGVREGY